MTWRFHSDIQPWSGSHRLFIAKSDRDTMSVVLPLTLKVIKGGVPYDDATLTESVVGVLGDGEVTSFLQAALDHAWARGLRPTGHADATNELAAVRYHLEDMRGLALKAGK